ncbi:hypothetical protein [Rhodococcoides fascians]|uniref:hypothetical protein n=1 Tax=Rhodococcoides fascians TaxID=1828 RepID=UPI000A5DD948|nr:hypothetical protein [Rhodococcus fascians]
MDGFDLSSPPGISDTITQKYLETLFANQIDGHELVANNSRWSNFKTRRTEHWRTRGDSGTPVVFIGDAVHTAHFSVGSGTKMAMEDAAALANSVASHSDIDDALGDFEKIRKPQVAKIQTSSVPSLSWWDHFGEYYQTLDPWQFGFHFFSRSISAEKMRARDPEFVENAENAWAEHHASEPLSSPLKIGQHKLRTRLLQIVGTDDGEIRLTDGTTTITAVSDYSSKRDAVVPLIVAPDAHGTTLGEPVRRHIETVIDTNPAAIAVRGGADLSRVLCSELIRLHTLIPSIIIDQPQSVRARRPIDENDCAATLILSGRADAVAFEAESTHESHTPKSAEVTR